MFAEVTAGSVALLAFAAAVYFLPSLFAALRGHHNGAAIFILNLFLGWTLIGWVAALVWSCTNPPPPRRV